MALKSKIKWWVKKISGKYIYTRLPFGCDPVQDILERVRHYKFNLIFDVGANLGQTAIQFHKKLPASKILCFEPSASTFRQLKENLAHLEANIDCYNIALGDEERNVVMVHSGKSDQFKIVASEVEASSTKLSSEIVRMETLSGFCIRNNIKHISYLKIDTEGFDLAVLQSGIAFLQQYKIDFIEVEVGMNPTNTLHVPLETIKTFMESENYLLFGIYEQVQEWIANKPILRRVNALFISPKLYE